MYYRRKRSKSRMIAIFCFFLLFGSLVYGYFTNDNEPLSRPYENEENSNLQSNEEEPNSNQTNNNVDPEENTHTEVDEVSREQEEVVDSQDNNVNLVTQKTKIIFNTYYKTTGEMIIEDSSVPVTVVGLRLSEFKDYVEDYYAEWKIKSISTEGVTLFKEVDGYKPNQFIIQEKDGYIVVYKIDENGEKVLHYETDISLSILNEIDRNKLKKGIVVKNFDAALNIIQDYNS